MWAVGGPALVRRIVLLASRMKDSFEEAATKILVVFFSHRHIQDAVREAGAAPRALKWQRKCSISPPENRPDKWYLVSKSLL